MATLQLTFGAYLLVLLAIGGYFFLTTETHRLSDYLLAGLAVSIGNLYLANDLFPILVWPVCLAVIVGVALATSEGGADVAGVPAPGSTSSGVDPADD